MKTQESKTFSTIDGATLMSIPLQPLNFVVDTLLSQGLHILAGSPKVGKSWLALWLAVSVAKGEPVAPAVKEIAPPSKSAAEITVESPPSRSSRIAGSEGSRPGTSAMTLPDGRLA